MKREVFFLIGANDVVLWSDASESALALPDSRARWEAIWSHRAEPIELAHSHPVGPDAFSHEDVTTMEALDVALGKPPRFSLITPHGYFVRAGAEVSDATSRTQAHRAQRGERAPAWTESLRAHSGMSSFPRQLLNPELRASLERWSASPPTETARLEPLRAALKQHRAAIFVCTHNARRSQLAQCIAWAAARWHGLAQHHFFSAGTEPGQVDPRSFAALGRAGFGVRNNEVRLSASEAPVVLSSKQLGDASLPSRFVATMVCSAADSSCPIVDGAAARVSLPHEDPSVTGDFDACVEALGRELVWALAPQT